MGIFVVLAAILFSAILRTLWIKKHGKTLGMEKKKTRLRKDGDQ